MNWIKPSMIFVVAGLTIVLMTACGTSTAVLRTPTAIPTLILTPVTSSPAPVPPSLTPLPTATVPPSRTTAPTTTVPPSRTTAPTTTFTPTVSPKDMLMAAFAKALANLKTYRVEIPQEGRYVAVQLPDRMLQEGIDYLLVIGPRIWMYDANDELQSGTLSGSLPFFDRANLIWLRDQFAQSPQVVLLGPGVAEGVPCIGYSANFTVTMITPPKTPGATPETTGLSQPVKIWFATADGFPRRVEMGAPTPITINFYDFNLAFELNPP